MALTQDERRAIGRIGREVAGLKESVRQLRTAKLRHSSVEGGALTVNDDAGEVRVVIGEQPDGTVAVVQHGGNAPQAPAAPVVIARAGVLVVAGIGAPVAGAWPADIGGIEIHLSTDGPDYEPSETTLLQTLPAVAGQELTVSASVEEQWVRLVAVTASGQRSVASLAQSGTPSLITETEILPGSITTPLLAATAIDGMTIRGVTIIGTTTSTSDDVGDARVVLSDRGVQVLDAGQEGAPGTYDFSIFLAATGNAWFRKNVYIDGTLHINAGSTSFINNGGSLLSLGQPYMEEGTYGRLAAGSVEAGRWVPISEGLAGRAWPRTLLRPYGLEFQGPDGAAAGFLSAAADYMRLSSYTDILVTPEAGRQVVIGTASGGTLVVQDMPTASSGTAVLASPSGLFYKAASSRRYKTDIEPADGVPVLDAELVTFRDLGEIERWADPDAPDRTEPRLHVGVIAEQLVDAGLDAFVMFDAEGRPDSVAYDRLAVALIPVVRDLADRVTTLEGATP